MTSVGKAAGPSDPAPPAVPDHELLRRVGRGSYGEVWLARSVVGTFRAVKLVYRKTFDHERPFEREFLGIQKFEPISRTHPGLVSILHIGKSPAGFYYVMEIADDQRSGSSIDPRVYAPKTLASEIRDRGTLPPAECARLGWRLTAALDHLHRHGLVHRDIKPSNIIFVNGAPKVADIGLVTHIGDGATLVGTAGYIPPEGPGSPLADLYSLGKVLYEISLGKDREEFPELPTRLAEQDATTPLMQLNEIILKACDPNPQMRFPSAGQMHDALAGLLEDKPSTDRPADTPVSPQRRPAEPNARVVLLNVPTQALAANLARRLVERLAASGFDVLQDDQPQMSLAWARDIESQIQEADAVIALLSAESIRNEMFAYEIEIARQSIAANPRRFRLLTVRVRFPDELPIAYQIALDGALTFSWDDPTDNDRLVKELVRVLRPAADHQPGG